ncbi:hypothetical protein Vadar_033773 [Vaccinium darrowii]|uniref:Uncharacterized protein n=1 Tax=Vaccinium darrowii TaxID=229202 RepID=A0ACB7XVA4_9ERIC|nr:hypothetical protein Vadar_033773 [Vaccinium darrowii]
MNVPNHLLAQVPAFGCKAKVAKQSCSPIPGYWILDCAFGEGFVHPNLIQSYKGSPSHKCRDHPLTNSSAVLTIAADGNMAIRGGRSFYMLSNVTSSGNTSATLLDSGNLVLIDRRSGDWNAGDKSGGCVRKMPLQCGNDSEVNGQKDQFLRISKVRLPDNSIALSQVRSIGDCQSACFSNCSCSAYTYEGSDGCSIWHEDLLNVDQQADDTTDGKDFYLRLAASEILSERKDSIIKWWKWIILALAVPMTLLVAVGFFYCLWRRKSQNKGEDLVVFDLGISIGAANCKVNEVGKSRTGITKEVDLPLFSFASVSAATDNFSDANKLGEGGFGPVYKGKLQKGGTDKVSVKMVIEFGTCCLNFMKLGINTIFQGQSVTASTTITSSGNEFELGFFSPGIDNSTKSSYLGVWYKRVSIQTVVWVANRDHCLTNSSAVLTIAEDGNLAIQAGRTSYMLSNVTSSGNTSATLLDSGNLVLIDRRSGDLLWQSFDYPSDTFLPGMKLGFDKRNGKNWSLLAWKTKDDPGPGGFSIKLDTQWKNQFSILKGSQKYWTSGPWNGQFFVQQPEMHENPLYKYIFVSNENESYFSYSFKDPSVTGRSVLDISGQMQVLIWLEARGEWNLLYARPGDQCNIYAYCGPFGTCNRNHITYCQCFRGFHPKSIGDWNAGDKSGGCVRKMPLQCGNDSEVNGQKDQFLRISKVRLPDNSIALSQVRSIGDCQSTCFSNCSCSAYTYEGSDGCSIWCEDLLNVDQLADDTTDGRDFYLRLAASEILSKRKDSRIKWWKWIILALAVPMTLLVAVGFFYCLWRRKSQNKGEDLVLFDLGISIGAANCKVNEVGKSCTGKAKVVDLPLFSFASVSTATDNFSDANKLGEGGFGPVYKGKLQKGIFGGNGSQATNRIVGTYGYMSPEYALEGFYNTDAVNLLGYAWDLWKSGMGESIRDPLLQDISSANMLLRYVNIALLCVQESAADRPTMSDVALMLSNELMLLASPKQPAFSTSRSVPERNSSKQSEDCSINDATISSLEAR